jgi:hypothetical protein
VDMVPTQTTDYQAPIVDCSRDATSSTGENRITQGQPLESCVEQSPAAPPAALAAAAYIASHASWTTAQLSILVEEMSVVNGTRIEMEQQYSRCRVKSLNADQRILDSFLVHKALPGLAAQWLCLKSLQDLPSVDPSIAILVPF